MAADRRPPTTGRWQTSAPGAAQIQGRTPATSNHIRRRPRVKAS